MKKIFFAMIFALLIASLFVLRVCAEEPPALETVGEIEAEAPAEEPATSAEKSIAQQAADWLGANFEKIIVALASLYAVFPKVGLIPLLMSAINKFKQYIDDKNNPNSIYNVLSANATTVSKFMTDFAPIIEEMKSGNASVAETLKKVQAEKEQANAALLACQQSMRLMAKELNDLISCSTTISAKTKAQIETEWREEETRIAAMLGGDNNDSQKQGKTA